MGPRSALASRIARSRRSAASRRLRRAGVARSPAASLRPARRSAGSWGPARCRTGCSTAPRQQTTARFARCPAARRRWFEGESPANGRALERREAFASAPRSAAPSAPRTRTNRCHPSAAAASRRRCRVPDRAGARETTRRAAGRAERRSLALRAARWRTGPRTRATTRASEIASVARTMFAASVSFVAMTIVPRGLFKVTPRGEARFSLWGDLR